MSASVCKITHKLIIQNQKTAAMIWQMSINTDHFCCAVLDFSGTEFSITLFPAIIKDLNGGSKLLHVAYGVPQGPVLKMLALIF